MTKCIKCGSYAFNLYKEDIDQGGFCDVHYWQGRAHRAEALAQSEQEPFGYLSIGDSPIFQKEKPEIGRWETLYTTPPQRTWNNGGKTGWPPGLLQDDCKGLSKGLANQPDAKRRVQEALAEQPAQQEPWNEDEWRKNNWRCGHGWLRGEQCEICNAAQEPVACLDCGSHNVGRSATYDSLINSVKKKNT